jgi:hypothetical protein
MSILRNRAVRLSMGAFSFLILAGLLLALYAYLDFQRLKQQKAYSTPENAFLMGYTVEEATIEFSTREFQSIAGIEIMTFDDVWFVAGHVNRNGERKPVGGTFFRANGGWVRVSEISPTPFVVCAARRIGQELAWLLGP